MSTPTPTSRSLLRLWPVLAGALSAACGGASKGGAETIDPAALVAYTEASMLGQQGDWARAAARFDEAAALEPREATVWMAAARARARLADWGGAIERAERALALAPGDAEAVHLLASICLDSGDVERAREVYRERLERAGDDPATWWRYGAMLARSGDAEGAESALVRATELNPDQVEAWERLGALRTRLRRPAAAAAAYDRAVALDPERGYLNQAVLQLAVEGGDIELVRRAALRISQGDQVAAALAVAALLHDRDDLFDAALELERLLKIRPGEERARLMLALILAKVGRAEDALEALDGIPPESPRSIDAARLRVRIALKQGDHHRAAELATRALERAPGEVRLVLLLASAHRAAGAYGQALRVLDEALAEQPDQADLRYLKGLVLQASGDRDAALEVMTSILALEGRHPGALNFVGYSWADRGQRLGEAESLIRQAVRLQPEDGAIMDSLGWVLFRRGQLGEAEKTLRQALRLAPRVAEIHFHLAEVLAAGGRRGEALEALRASIRHAAGTPQERLYRERLRAIEGGAAP